MLVVSVNWSHRYAYLVVRKWILYSNTVSKLIIKERDDNLPPLPKGSYVLLFSTRYWSILDDIDWVEEALSMACDEISLVKYVETRAYLINTRIVSRLVLGLQNIRHCKIIWLSHFEMTLLEKINESVEDMCREFEVMQVVCGPFLPYPPSYTASIMLWNIGNTLNMT